MLEYWKRHSRLAHDNFTSICKHSVRIVHAQHFILCAIFLNYFFFLSFKFGRCSNSIGLFQKRNERRKKRVTNECWNYDGDHWRAFHRLAHFVNDIDIHNDQLLNRICMHIFLRQLSIIFALICHSSLAFIYKSIFNKLFP